MSERRRKVARIAGKIAALDPIFNPVELRTKVCINSYVFSKLLLDRMNRTRSNHIWRQNEPELVFKARTFLGSIVSPNTWGSCPDFIPMQGTLRELATQCHLGDMNWR